MTSKFSPKWNPQYVEKLREHLHDGYSFVSFAGKIKIDYKTLYEWARTIPEFRAVKLENKVAKPKLYA